MQISDQLIERLMIAARGIAWDKGVTVSEAEIARQHTRQVLEAALSAAEPVPVAYRHTLHSVRGQTDVEVNTGANHPFGRPGVDYSPEYWTTTEPLYAAPPSVAVKDILAELDNVLVNDEQDRETLAKIRTMVSALSAQEQDVAGWQPIEAAPHDTNVLLAWADSTLPCGWKMEAGMASWGWRRDGVSNMSEHGQATHWMPLPSAPAAPAKQEGGE
ncbi:hypothetical protein J2855_001799 [Agrobacterium tumefaciens]|uniref:DUF551 domain-containing protein n=1 Tax=Agrobacterium tumefaciens TaxID=358 RepID=UPI001AE96F80|nr:DUF551 domain-containing protein [Agrobacterium tumefaciens]MBP2508164.1 hypothetical protein [Agrobacterium tumefaciens]MBP2517316.1 hypothetical protein [Agrobacterium tumefaciens]MBP2575950.1 hypothetical protein [Agrobacterium tumefaciens]MBP2594306.1 hypothetical protein [Agrobacterium tumefaciens]